MAKSILVTKCDNELIILAYQWGISYEVCRILSGNTNQVNVQININEGAFQNTVTLNGVNQALNQTVDVTIPKGDYSFLLVGVNWGGPHEFAANVDGTNYLSPYATTGVGLVWNSEPIALSI